MQTKIRIKFSSEEMEVLTELARVLKMPIEKLCKQSVLFTLSNAYKKALSKDEQLNTPPTVPVGNNQTEPNSASVNSATLSQQDNSTVDTKE